MICFDVPHQRLFVQTQHDVLHLISYFTWINHLEEGSARFCGGDIPKKIPISFPSNSGKFQVSGGLTPFLGKYVLFFTGIRKLTMNEFYFPIKTEIQTLLNYFSGGLQENPLWWRFKLCSNHFIRLIAHHSNY